jgi:malic enzyme
MKIHAAEAIAKTLTKKASVDYIIPDSLNRDVTLKISEEIGKCVQK